MAFPAHRIYRRAEMLGPRVDCREPHRPTAFAFGLAAGFALFGIVLGLIWKRL
jgi:hypothetical protein